MADTASLDPIPNGEGVPTLKPRIDPITRLLVLRLKQAEPDRSSASIAATIGDISEATVRRLLSNYATDAKQLTKSLMQMTAPERLENWETACEIAAAKGDHRPSKDYLIAAELLDAAADTTVTVGFQVVVAPSPGTPAYDTTVLTTTHTECVSSSDPQLELPPASSSRLRR